MKKIAVVCGSPASEFLAPFDDPSWEIWVLGNRINRFDDKRVTRIFEIHDDLSEHGDPLSYAQYVAAKGIPMVVGDKFPVEAAHIKKFDFDAACDLYGTHYLTSSTVYMIAQAMMDGATHIGIYGVDMSVDSHEYFYQRPCLESWIGFAKGRGIDVYIPPISPVGRCDYIEGRGCGGKPNFSRLPFTQKEFMGMVTTHADKISDLQYQIRQAELTIHMHSGAQQAYERLAKIARAVEAGQDIQNISDSVVIRG